MNTAIGTFSQFSFREDADGKTFIRAKAEVGDCTADYPKFIFHTEDGYDALALYDSGFTSATCQPHHCYFGVPDDTISSESYGWFQIGGYKTGLKTTTTTVTQGRTIYATDAAIIGNTGTWTGKGWQIAIGYTSASATQTHDVMMVPRMIQPMGG